MQLNDFLQRRYGAGGPGLITWETAQAGPAHAPVWTMVLRIRGVVWGQAAGGRQGEAMEAAAGQALSTISQGYQP